MNWFTGTMVYLVLWWLVLFAVLPWGVRPSDDVEPGHDKGAPDKPRLWLKALITTAIAAIIWAGVYWAVTSEVISLRGGY